MFAAEVPIAAAIVWYGAASKREWEVTPLQPKPLEDVIAAVNCPVFGAFGEGDHIISIDDVLAFPRLPRTPQEELRSPHL